MVVKDHKVNHVQDHNEIILLAKEKKQRLKNRFNRKFLRVSFLDMRLIFDYKIYKQNPPFVAYFP
jgi:hypothetical protein